MDSIVRRWKWKGKGYVVVTGERQTWMVRVKGKGVRGMIMCTDAGAGGRYEDEGAMGERGGTGKLWMLGEEGRRQGQRG